ncbi:MAG: hypothetical protein HY819_08195 [Acidobacteria bacterium]|nr:hypothetical protein [Acidobacteriota bacterium]
MFTLSQFENLYSLLSLNIVEEDCGIRCDKYCCKTPNTIKYFLPGEEEYFTISPLNNLQIVEHYLFTGYQGKDESNCFCTRELRPFCCRIFPFRPVIDINSFQVIDLKKATSLGFDKYCWIASPLPDWHKMAIKAWQEVLEDKDNLGFYAKYALFLKQARLSYNVSTSSLLYEVTKDFDSMTFVEKWKEVISFFDLIGQKDF